MAKPMIRQGLRDQILRSGRATPEQIDSVFTVVPDSYGQQPANAFAGAGAGGEASAPALTQLVNGLSDPSSTTRTAADYLSGITYPFARPDVALGAVKSAGETAAGLASLIRRIPGVGDALDEAAKNTGASFGLNSSGRVNSSEAFSNPAATNTALGLNRDGLAQKTGALAEQVAEFGALGAAEGPAWLAKLSSPAQARLAALAEQSPRVANLLDIGAQGAREAAQNSAVGVARGDSPTALSVGLSAAGPAMGELAGAIAPKIAAGQMEKIKALYTKVLAPNSARTRNVAASVVDQMAEDAPWFASRASLGDTASSRTEQLANAIELAHDAKVAQGATIPASAVAGGIDQKINALTRPVEKEIVVNGIPMRFTADVPLPGNEDAVDALKNYKTTFSDDPVRGLASADGNIQYSHLLDARRSIDNRLRAKGVFDAENASVDPATMADWHSAAALRDILNSENPEAAALHGDFGQWNDVNRLVNSTSNGVRFRDRLKQGLTSSPVLGMAAVGADVANKLMAHSASPGLEIGGALLGTAATMKAIKSGMQSTAFRTADAGVRKAIVNALSSGNADVAAQLLSKIGAATADDAPQIGQ